MLPADFAKRVATKIVFTNERERDPDAALEKTCEFLQRTLSAPDRLRYFVDALEVLEDDEETLRFAGLSFVSLVLGRQEEPRFEKFVNDILDVMIEDHYGEVKPPHQEENRKRKFSAYARILGDSFIAMMDINTELYEVVAHIHSLLIRKEMEIDVNSRDRKREDDGGRRISMSRKEGPRMKQGKKLFDDVVDYIHARGEVPATTLHQGNPNEYIAILADRMRGTRRYVVQDILNRQALQRKKEAEKELSERLAGAEEIIIGRDAFKKSVGLFWTEKQYNFKYLSVEKVRVTLQVLGLVIGIGYFLAGYLSLYGMEWWEGLIVMAAMWIFSRFFGSRQVFRTFYPNDVSKEMEVVVGSFTPILRKMSKDQLDAFLFRQVRDPDNKNLLPVFPEFLKYVFLVMPDRRNIFITMEEVGDVLQNMELDISRVIRGAGGRGSELNI